MNFENLIKLLDENEKYDSKKEIFKCLLKFKNILHDTVSSCNEDAADAGENFNFEKLKTLQKLKIEIDNTLEKIDNILELEESFLEVAILCIFCIKSFYERI